MAFKFEYHPVSERHLHVEIRRKGYLLKHGRISYQTFTRDEVDYIVINSTDFKGEYQKMITDQYPELWIREPYSGIGAPSGYFQYNEAELEKWNSLIDDRTRGILRDELNQYFESYWGRNRYDKNIQQVSHNVSEELGKTIWDKLAKNNSRWDRKFLNEIDNRLVDPYDIDNRLWLEANVLQDDNKPIPPDHLHLIWYVWDNLPRIFIKIIREMGVLMNHKIKRGSYGSPPENLNQEWTKPPYDEHLVVEIGG